jgi:FdhD protein
MGKESNLHGPRPAAARVQTHTGTACDERNDFVAVEEPMEIRVVAGEQRLARSVSVTMRTPGHDFELAVGFLCSEGMIRDASAIQGVEHCGPPPPGLPHSNIVRVDLQPEVELDLVKLQRNFYSTSSCGICGKASLEALNFEGYEPLDLDWPQLDQALIHTLPEKLLSQQSLFEKTGGLHAAGLFDEHGTLLACREDVGRHNAIDKLVGARLLDCKLGRTTPAILVVSGRVSFEVMQKALAARFPVVVAVGSPTSLAVTMAQRFNITLAGFVRGNRYNVYSTSNRISNAITAQRAND